MTLGQIEQLLGQLSLPPLPPRIAGAGALQNVTQQSSGQTQGDVSARSDQSQVAAQSNATVQVAGGSSDPGAGPAIVNRTAQGIWQIQVGCLFDCTGTRQLQQATQSNATVQAPAGAPAANTVTQLIWQLQIGCLLLCYDAVESQGALATDSTTVVPPAPLAPPAVPASPGVPPAAPVGSTAAPEAPVAPSAPAAAPVVPVAPAPSPGGDVSGPMPPTRGDVGARTTTLGARLVLAAPGPGRAVFQAVGVSVGSTTASGGGSPALVAVTVARSVAVESSQPVARSARNRQLRPEPHTVRGVQRSEQAGHSPRASARRVAAESSAGPGLWLWLLMAADVVLALTALAPWRRER